MIPYGDGKSIHVPHESGQIVSGIEYDFVGYPQARYCANNYACAAHINGHPQKLSYRNEDVICFACKARDLRRKLGRITADGELFERKMRREGMSL